MFGYKATFQRLSWLIFIPFFLTTAYAQTIQNIIWNVPDGKLPDLSQTFTSGQTLPLSWNAYNSVQYLDTTKNFVDLWVTAFDLNLNPLTQRLTGMLKSLNNNLAHMKHMNLIANTTAITVGLNLTSSGNFAWTIAIPDGNLTISAKYVLRFKITSPTFNLNNGELSSPGFLVLRAAPASTSSMSSTQSSTSRTSTTSSITVNTPIIMSTTTRTPSATPTATSSGLSGGAKGGISVGVIVGVLALGTLSYFFLSARKRKREEQAAELTGVLDENKNGHVAGPAEMPARSVAAELPVNYYQ